MPRSLQCGSHQPQELSTTFSVIVGALLLWHLLNVSLCILALCSVLLTVLLVCRLLFQELASCLSSLQLISLLVDIGLLWSCAVLSKAAVSMCLQAVV